MYSPYDNYGAHGPYTLVGPPVRRLVLDPLVAFTSTTVYTSRHNPEAYNGDLKNQTNLYRNGHTAHPNQQFAATQFLPRLISATD